MTKYEYKFAASILGRVVAAQDAVDLARTAVCNNTGCYYEKDFSRAYAILEKIAMKLHDKLDREEIKEDEE